MFATVLQTDFLGIGLKCGNYQVMICVYIIPVDQIAVWSLSEQKYLKIAIEKAVNNIGV